MHHLGSNFLVPTEGGNDSLRRFLVVRAHGLLQGFLSVRPAHSGRSLPHPARRRNLRTQRPRCRHRHDQALLHQPQLLARGTAPDGARTSRTGASDRRSIGAGCKTGHGDGILKWADERTLLVGRLEYELVIASLKAGLPRGVEIVPSPQALCQGVMRGWQTARGIYVNFLLTRNAVYLPIFGLRGDDEASDRGSLSL
jgi:hypothetical protein